MENHLCNELNLESAFEDFEIDQGFINYASKSPCFMKFLLDTGRAEKADIFEPYQFSIKIHSKALHNALYLTAINE